MITCELVGILGNQIVQVTSFVVSGNLLGEVPLCMFQKSSVVLAEQLGNLLIALYCLPILSDGL